MSAWKQNIPEADLTARSDGKHQVAIAGRTWLRGLGVRAFICGLWDVRPNEKRRRSHDALNPKLVEIHKP